MTATWRERSIRLIKEETDKKKLQKVMRTLDVYFIGVSQELYFFLDNKRGGFSIQKNKFSVKKLIQVTLRFRAKYPCTERKRRVKNAR